MHIQLTAFVCGNIQMRDGLDTKQKVLSDNNGNVLAITIGDELVVVSNSPCQKWIDRDYLGGFDETPDCFYLSGMIVNVKGCCYIGKI